MLTIVMYHYVRDLRHSRFKAIKGLALDHFREQLAYIDRNYTVVSMEEVVWAAKERTNDLPENALLLTFDDGFGDHYSCVFPLLDERCWQGTFFPPAKPILERQVLDVHKVHFILASSPCDILVRELRHEFGLLRRSFGLLSWEHYWDRCGKPNRFDPAEVIFIKRMLQVELPEAARARIAENLFRKFVTADEAAFASELYMSLDQLRVMNRHGMHIGCHGYGHYWMNRLTRSQKVSEVEASLDFLRQIDPELGRWVISYPYGAYDEELLDIARSRGAALGLSAAVGVADLESADPMILPRIDAVDVPICAEIKPEIPPASVLEQCQA